MLAVAGLLVAWNWTENGRWQPMGQNTLWILDTRTGELYDMRGRSLREVSAKTKSRPPTKRLTEPQSRENPEVIFRPNPTPTQN